MARMSDADKEILINAIATREGTAHEISQRYGYSLKFLRSFVGTHKDAISKAREAWEEHRPSTEDTEPTPVELEHLWIASKASRLERLQAIADKLYSDCMADGVPDAASLREFRSYCVAAANELGQLLNRGSGDSGSDTLNVDIQGVDFEQLR